MYTARTQDGLPGTSRGSPGWFFYERLEKAVVRGPEGLEEGQGYRMNQSDFRRILATPKPGGKSDFDGPQKKNNNSGKTKRPYKKPGAWKKKEEEGDEPGTQYRDRAKERQQDANPDYNPDDVRQSNAFHLANEARAAEAEATPWSGPNMMPPPSNLPTKTKAQLESEIEESKYLGGDMEHTHLVKGLDFALLNKVRSEMAAAKKVDENEKEEDEEAEKKSKSKVAKTEAVKKFQSQMGKAIHATLFDAKPRGRAKCAAL